MAGKKVYTEISEIIDKSHTALVVWDVQNMLVERIFNKDEFMSNLNKLIDSARKTGIAIFYTKITPLPERFESKARLAAMKNFGQPGTNKGMLDLVVQPASGEIVISKNTASLFIGTNFELMARNAGIETIVFTGIATEIGIESSAREAANRGFYSVVAKQAVSSSEKEAHLRSLENMKKVVILAGVDEILNAWTNK